ncbi:hypothetical protein NC995_19925 [Leptolyngbya sp. FACHB-1515]
MYKPILVAIALSVTGGAVTLGSGAVALRSLTWTAAGATAQPRVTDTQLTACRNFLPSVFPQVPAADITVSSGGDLDNQGNARVNWQLKDGTAGFCVVNASNQVVRYETQFTPSPSPSPSPSPTPSPTPSPSPSPFDPQSLRDLNKDEAISLAQQNGYALTDASDPQRVRMANNQQQLILNIRRFFNTVSSVEVTSLPTPTPSPSPGAFNPLTLVGLEKNRAIATAQQNGYTLNQDSGNQVFLSNNVQGLILNVGQPLNTVTSVAISSNPTPTPTPSPSPGGGQATIDQLQTCRTFVADVFSPANATVFSGSPDVAGNAIVEWRTSSGASGYCRMDNSNNIIDFIVENPGEQPEADFSPRPPVIGLW